MTSPSDQRPDQFAAVDPTTRYPRPDFPEQSQEHPGTGSAMHPEPDYGEASYRGSGRLAGRRAVVTGGDSGIGRAVALAFAREGADVLVSCLPEEEVDARVTAGLVEAAGRRAVVHAADLREEEACQRLVRHAVDSLGGVDVLVCNAAYQMALDGLEDLSSEQLLRTYTTNVFATLWLCKAALPHLQPGASIVVTSSIEAYDPKPSLVDYASTKAALVNITKSLARQLAPRGVRVNSVAPGPVWTPLIPATMPTEQVGSFGSDTPLGRPAQPAELAPPYVFLASGESGYVTGEVLGVTGGRLLP